MGKSILLLWPDDQQWYGADVINYDPSNNKYLVRYHADGSSEWIALPISKNGKIWKLQYDIKRVKFSLGGESLGTTQYSLPIRWMKKEAASPLVPPNKKPKVVKNPPKVVTKTTNAVKKEPKERNHSKKVKKQAQSYPPGATSKSDLHSSDSDIETLIKQAQLHGILHHKQLKAVLSGRII